MPCASFLIFPHVLVAEQDEPGLTYSFSSKEATNCRSLQRLHYHLLERYLVPYDRSNFSADLNFPEHLLLFNTGYVD